MKDITISCAFVDNESHDIDVNKTSDISFKNDRSYLTEA